MTGAGPDRTAERATDVIRALLAVTAAREGDVRSTIDELGAERTARVVVDEIVFRAGLSDLARPGSTAAVTIVLTHGGRDLTATVGTGPDGMSIQSGPGSDPAATPVVTQDLAEAAVALYGPAELVTASTRTIRWPGPEVVFPTPQRPNLPTEFYAIVQRVVQVLDRQEPADLTELAVRYGADKWGAMHRYPRHYQRHFAPRRQHRLTILEIGIGGFDSPARGGASLRMWKHFFPRALVYGVDILDKRPLDAPRLTTIQADQSSVDEMTKVAEAYGPFDIVIDDGSHISRHVITTFKTLFPYVRRNGMYIIEDLQASYWPEMFEGTETDLDDPRYTVGFLKTLLDGLHHEDLLRPDARTALPSDPEIESVHVYRNLAVLEKGPNTEGSLVADLFRAARANG